MTRLLAFLLIVLTASACTPAAAVAWIDQQLPDIDWTMSGAEIRRAAGKAGTGLQRRYGREAGHDDRLPAGVASLERLSR